MPFSPFTSKGAKPETRASTLKRIQSKSRLYGGEAREYVYNFQQSYPL